MDVPPRFLLVEDDAAEASAIEGACNDLGLNGLEIVVARSAAEAISAVRSTDFDLVVCDLRLPPEVGVLPADGVHGRAVLDAVRDASPGTPVIVLSAYLDVPTVQEITEASRRLDVFGATDWQMVGSCRKLNLAECIQRIGEMLREIEALAAMPMVVQAPVSLSRQEARILQIYAVRRECSEIRISELGDGLSGTKTLRAELIGGNGIHLGQVAAKLGSRERVVKEAERHQQMAALLPPGLGAQMLRIVDAGGGSSGGVFYQLAIEHTRSLFDLLSKPAEESVAVVQRLRERFAETYKDAPVDERLVSAIVLGFVSRYQMGGEAHDLAFLDEIEGQSVETTDSLQHGDLHGMNVLVDDDGAPLAIDYADVRRAPASTDPVTLELSAVFHPVANALRGGWPSEACASCWPNLDAFLEGCPFPAFVTACREWAMAVAASREEVMATGMGYALRQLKYEDTPSSIALAIARSCAEEISGV